ARPRGPRLGVRRPLRVPRLRARDLHHRRVDQLRRRQRDDGVGSPMRLQGRVAAITGGALGIGRATGLSFAAEGAVVALGDVELDAAEAVAREIREAGGRAIAVRVDVGDAGQVRASVRAGVAAYGRL